MKLLTFLHNGVETAGILSREGTAVHPLSSLGCGAASIQELIAEAGLPPRLAEALESAPHGIPLEQVTLCAPIPHPRHDLLCIGQNYLEHALESARFSGVTWTKPKHPLYFSKRVNRAVPHGGKIPAHGDITSQLDYEAELAVVIGRTCRQVKPEEVFDCIFGYTIVNDVSARDLQSAHVQFTVAKGLDGFTPMGPWIVTADEFDTPPHLQVKTLVNGELRQDGNTDQFIFDIPHMVCELSRGMTLEPGDIILTGTPSGVGMSFQPPRFLKPGDKIECSVQGIGTLTSYVE